LVEGEEVMTSMGDGKVEKPTATTHDQQQQEATATPELVG
jgi:hypothetical protein